MTRRYLLLSLAPLTARAQLLGIDSPPAEFHGTVRSLDKKKLVLLLENDNEMEFRITRKTAFVKDGKEIKPAAIPAGAPVMIEAHRDVLGNIDALKVTVEK